MTLDDDWRSGSISVGFADGQTVILKQELEDAVILNVESKSETRIQMTRVCK